MTPETAQKTDALIAELWQRNLSKTRERVDLLHTFALAAAAATLAEPQRQEAIAISHKFAGSLGMYGYPRGTDICRDLEQLFRNLPPAQPDVLTPQVDELRQLLFPS
jgi:HPt (histidine-containing phosphotransfer) domain-containing protein